MREFLKKIAGLTPAVFIMGGFAEDVLLGQSLDRPYKDLDLLVRRDGLDRVIAQLETIGVGEWELRLADSTGRTLMLGARVPLAVGGPAGGLELELYVAAPAPGDDVFIEVPAQGPAGRLRLFLPTDTFEYPAALMAGMSIQTVSPLALVWLRAASAQTRHTGEKGARDLAMADLLRQAFLPGYDEQQLQPRIELVNDPIDG